MTTSERFERDVPALLEDLYLGPTPPYRNDLLRRTAATSQRPGWTFIERWLPVSAITQRLTAAPRVPWRVVAVAALLILAIAAAAIYVGSQRRVPPPFGPADNGEIPYIWNGNIYLGDPISGESKLIVGDPGGDAVPRFSPEAREANQAFVDLLRGIAERMNATPAQIALGWLLAQQPWTVPIPGTTKLHRLEENLGAVDIELTPEVLRDIRAGASKLDVQGERLPAPALAMVGK